MLRLARTIARLLELSPQREIATSLSSPALDAAVASLFNASGAVAVTEEIAPAGVVELDKPPSPLVSEQARALISRVVGGGTIVVVIHRGPKFDENAQSAARRLGPMFDLEHVHGELVEAEGESPAAVVLRGKRRAQPSRDRVKELRGLAHNLDATILIGRDGLSEGLIASAREALERHGLVKAKLTPRARLDKDDSAVDLAWAAGGQLIQRVGKTAVIFRPDVPLSPPVMRR